MTTYYMKGQSRGYVIAYKKRELTDPMSKSEAEQLKQQWDKLFSGLRVKEVRF